MKYCKHCKMELDDNKFYKSNNHICIECIKLIRLEKRRGLKNEAIQKLQLNGFRSIESYKDYYINQHGEIVRVYKNGNINKLKGYICKNGYQLVRLYHNSAEYTHRLVAMTFIENSLHLPCVNHKDGNKLNNNVENLEWCTYSYNNQHAYNNFLKSSGEEHYNSILSKEQVNEIRKMSGKLSQDKISKIYNVSRGCIEQIVSNKTWQHI